MRRDLLESILWVIAIVLTTSAILYPVIITLTRRLAAFSKDLLESHLETVQILGSAIADVFDALTCERPCKKPFSYEKSMAMLEEGRGSHFDPKVLDAFNTLAESIYRDIAGREDESLKDDLERSRAGTSRPAWQAWSTESTSSAAPPPPWRSR